MEPIRSTTSATRCEAIVFDLDGTLIDSQRDIFTSVVVALRDQGIGHLRVEDLAAYQGYPLTEIYAALVPGANERGRQRFVHIYRAHYCDHCVDHTRAYGRVVETLERLADRKLAVATAKPTWSANQLLERLGLRAYFECVLGSEGRKPKPDPDVVLACLERLGTPVDRAAMVGDTDRDVLAARAAGVRAVAVSWGGWPRDQLARLRPDALIDRFDQLLDVV